MNIRSVRIFFFLKKKENQNLPATRRSHDKAISNPPPNAGPSMAAIVGIGSV